MFLKIKFFMVDYLNFWKSKKDLQVILFLFSMAYIFEYGYEIQEDSKGKMYNDKIMNKSKFIKELSEEAEYNKEKF